MTFCKLNPTILFPKGGRRLPPVSQPMDPSPIRASSSRSFAESQRPKKRYQGSEQR
jgi:hypothetical protein